MSTSKVKEYLRRFEKTDRIRKIKVPITAADEASDSLGTMPSKLAKCTAFLNKKGDGCIMIVTSGDATVDKARFKTRFRYLPEELDEEQSVKYTGHRLMALCPFAVNDEATVIYLDKSLKRFDYIYISAGDAYTVAKFSYDELFKCTNAVDWVDMGRIW